MTDLNKLSAGMRSQVEKTKVTEHAKNDSTKADKELGNILNGSAFTVGSELDKQLNDYVYTVGKEVLDNILDQSKDSKKEEILEMIRKMGEEIKPDLEKLQHEKDKHTFNKILNSIKSTLEPEQK